MSADNLTTDEEEEVVRVDGLGKHYGPTRAVDGVTFSIKAGETLALVGESGSGKSTTAQLILRLTDPSFGRIHLFGQDVTGYSRRQMRKLRREMQVVFQDPHQSLNPRMTNRDIVGEPLRIHTKLSRRDYRSRVDELLLRVGLSPSYGDTYPHAISGGQRQRVAIARATALRPRLLVLDEPVSALDVSIRAQVVNLLMDLQADLGLTYLFISHDLSVVRHVAHRVAVMYLGQIVEIGPTDAIFDAPAHPYTRALLSAIPQGRAARTEAPRRIILSGDPPNPAAIPTGCRFHPRCFMRDGICAVEEPALLPRTSPRHYSACHFAGAAQRGSQEKTILASYSADPETSSVQNT